MSYGLNTTQLTLYVVRPALQHIGLWSREAEALVLGTALAESRGEYLRQFGNGPAIGLWQMEPLTHDDIWANYLQYRPALAAKVRELELPNFYADDAIEMAGNLYYAAAMCRIHYYRHPAPLPGLDDPAELARYWKVVYNTRLGAGSVSAAIPHFEAAVYAVRQL